MSYRSTSGIKRLIQKEEGEILILLACIIYGVLFFAVVLLMDMNTGHTANLSAQHVADTATDAAKDIILLSSGLTALQAAADALPADGYVIGNDKRYKILKVRFFYPPITTELIADDEFDETGKIFDGEQDKSFDELGLSCPVGAECEVIVDAYKTGFGVDQNTPSDFWSIREHSAHFGVEVEVGSPTVFLEFAGIRVTSGRAKSFVSIRHRNGEALSGSITNSAQRPSFIVAYAGQSASHPLPDSSFTFSAGSFPDLDPLVGAYSGFTSSSIDTGVVKDLHHVSEGSSFSHPGLGGEEVISLPGYAAGTTQQEELAASCHSPFKAGTNQISSLITEVLSRVGTVRDTFQFLYVNSRSEGSPLIPNPPTVMKAAGVDPYTALGGSDLTSATILPFVNRRDTSNNYRCNFQSHPSCTEQQALYMEQLRYCNHSFSSVGNGGREAAPLRFEFDDLHTYGPSEWANGAYVNQTNPAAVSWGQYGDFLPKDRLSLPGAVRTIGSEQRCPIDSAGCEKPKVGGVITPSALSNPGQNVKPDIVAAFDYALTVLDGWNRLGPLVHPGYTPLATTARIGNSDQQSGVTHPSDLLLILHQRLDPADASYHDLIRNRVGLLNSFGARVFVLFFARTPEDEGIYSCSAGAAGSPRDSVMALLEDTFCANGSTAGGACSGGARNVVYRLSPGADPALGCNRQLPVFDSSCAVIQPEVQNSNLCFQAYWEDMLTAGGRSGEEFVRHFLQNELFQLVRSL